MTVCRVGSRWSSTIPGAGSVAMRMDFTDYGRSVDVSAPPASETISMQQLQSLGAD